MPPREATVHNVSPYISTPADTASARALDTVVESEVAETSSDGDESAETSTAESVLDDESSDGGVMSEWSSDGDSPESPEYSSDITDDDFIVADDESCIAHAGSDSEYVDSSEEEELGAMWVHGHREYEIERIISHRVFPEATYFLVRWSGYTASDDTWLSTSELVHARELLNEYKHSVGLL